MKLRLSWNMHHTQPSTLHGTVKCVSALWLSINKNVNDGGQRTTNYKHHSGPRFSKNRKIVVTELRRIYDRKIVITQL